MRIVFLVCPWALLFTLACALLRLPALIFILRAFLRRRRRDRPLGAVVSLLHLLLALPRPLLRLRAWHGCTALLGLRCRVGTLAILLAAAFLLRRTLLSPLRSLWLSLQSLFLVVLPYYNFTRLVTVILTVKLTLLLHAGISIP